MNNFQQNNLVSGYQKFSANNVPFNNNAMIANNPMFAGSIRDPAFYQRMHVAKLEQLKKVKNIGDMNITKEQLLQYIICPMKAEKLNKEQSISLYNDKNTQYVIDKLGKNTSKLLADWWNSRTNMPYKNILKNVKILDDNDYKKKINKIDDLIVKRLIDISHDGILLQSQYSERSELLEAHNNELKMIYSLSKKLQYKEEFEYVQKYKYRLKHDPKSYDELKKYYKQEQHKIIKETKRIDDMIESLLENEEISNEDFETLKKMHTQDQEQYQEQEKQIIIIDSEHTDDIDTVELDLKNKLKNELSKEEYNEFIKSYDDNNDNKEKNKKQIKEIKLESEDKKPKKKVVIKTTKIIKENEENIKIEDKSTGQLEDDIFQQYKNRKKPNKE